MEETNLQGANPAEDATPAPETQAPAESSPATVAPEQAPDDAGAELSRVQKRIDRLTWEAREAERRAIRAEAMLEERAARAQPQQQQPPGAPTLEQFDGDVAQFQAAWVKYTDSVIEDRLNARLAEREQREQQTTVLKSFKQREAEFIAKQKDYQEKVYDPSKTYFTAEVAKQIAECEDGPAVAYYLADNPDIGAQLAQLPPMALAREIGKIEAKLSLPKPAPVVVSKAPAPPPKVDAVDPDVKKGIDDPTLSDAEFNRIRKRQIAQRR